MTKDIAYDFGMDSFVAVMAPEGIDPETLHEQAIEKFKELLASGKVDLEFLHTTETTIIDDNIGYKPKDGEPDDSGDFRWVSVHRHGKTIVMQEAIVKSFPGTYFATEDGLPVVVIPSSDKRKELGKRLAELTGYNVYYSQRMAGNCGIGGKDKMFFLGYAYNPKEDDRRSMEEYALEFAKVYASPEEEAVGNRYNENGDGKVAWPLK